MKNHPYHLRSLTETIHGGYDDTCLECKELHQKLLNHCGEKVELKLSDSGLHRIVAGKLTKGKYFEVDGEEVMFDAIRWVRLTS